jgi:metal-sulfur cluster biosynthetic enzyme
MDESTTHEPEPITDEGTRVIAAEPAAPAPGGSNGGPATEEAIREALKQVVDPELGINIVDLGLVYDVEISQEGAISIEYTLTTMGCPIGPLIEHQIQSFLENVPGVTSVEAEMVLRPPWTPEMMSEEAKAALGYF